MPVQFFDEDAGFLPENQEMLTEWVQKIAKEHGRKIDVLNYILCSDEYLLEINQEYLQHEDYTDIITFDHSEESSIIEGDVFISIERVKENASQLHQSFVDEFHRVLAHGLLHLLGFKDKTPDDQKVMTEKEDACLSLRHS